MKILFTLLVLMLSLLGCKEQSANTGDLEMDFIIDTSNGLVDSRWADEEQKKKYSPLAKLSLESCKTRMGDAFVKLMNNNQALELLSSDERAAMDQIRRASPAQRDLAKGAIANRLCSTLSLLGRRA